MDSNVKYEVQDAKNELRYQILEEHHKTRGEIAGIKLYLYTLTLFGILAFIIFIILINEVKAARHTQHNQKSDTQAFVESKFVPQAHISNLLNNVV